MQTDLFKGFISIFTGKIGAVVLKVAIVPLLVRFLGSSKYGEYAFVMSLLGILMILVNAGINDGVRKYVAENRSQNGWADNVVGFYTRFGAILACMGALVLFLANASGITAILIGETFEPYLNILSIIIVSRQFFSITRSSLMGKGLEHLSEPMRFLRMLFFGIVGVGAAYLGFGVSGVLTGHLVASVITTGIGIVLIRRRFDLRSIFRKLPTNFPRRELVAFNSSTVVLILLINSLYHTDVLLLQPLAGSTATGYYRAALQVAEFLWFAPFALQMALLHSSSELWVHRDSSYITDVASRVTRYTFLFTLLLILGLAALADSFVPLYFSEEFTPAIVPLLILLPGSLGFAVSRPIFAIGQGKGDFRPLIVATGVAATVNLILNLSLIPRYGMTGAAISTSVGYGSMLLLQGAAARYIGYDPFADLRLGRISLTGIVAAPVIFGIDYLITSDVLSLLIVPPLGFLVYAVLAFRTRAIDRQAVLSALDRVPSSLQDRLKTLIDYI
ncbi:flippase [Haloarcula salina]|uniref:Flippase n=1 Tax=Haloarcula salina TaxID=1429914 RepID=A0AA41KDA1_9EURY|nr:flippase [Haloarcula salina]MBV0903310.1 flippase [Haloarcula salina]